MLFVPENTLNQIKKMIDDLIQKNERLKEKRKIIFGKQDDESGRNDDNVREHHFNEP